MNALFLCLVLDKKRGMTQSIGSFQNEEIEINKGYGI